MTPPPPLLHCDQAMWLVPHLWSGRRPPEMVLSASVASVAQGFLLLSSHCNPCTFASLMAHLALKDVMYMEGNAPHGFARENEVEGHPSDDV